MNVSENLLEEFQSIVGKRRVLRSARATLRFRRGFRTPAGRAAVVVSPGSLVELWRIVKACAAENVAIVMQAANTGLTGGSNPDDTIDRPVAIINTMRISRLHILGGGEQVLCMPGVTLHQLEQKLYPLGREPHSVIGSSCFGASVIGGVCNNSGGALIRRGPAYTELALFARINEDGCLELINRLGIDLGSDPETILRNVEEGKFLVAPAEGVASDREYCDHVREVDASTPARFNADQRRLCDAAGSAGKIVVFAVRLDTFPAAVDTTTFYVGTNAKSELTELRRSMLETAGELPISAEYLDRQTFDIADRYGRDTFYAIQVLGTSRIPRLYAIKARLDSVFAAIGIANAADRLLQGIGRILPPHLPNRLVQWRHQYEHYLILKVGAAETDDTRLLLSSMYPSSSGNYFECSHDEARKAWLHRFVAAGAAVRYLSIERKHVSDIVALDVALPRNSKNWYGDLPSDLKNKVVATLRYGHFFCHVFHRDYLIAKDAEPNEIKQYLLRELEKEGAEYPAEHNVGRQYQAKPALCNFYRKLDPTNRFNPGIGLTPTGANWTDESKQPKRNEH